MVTTAQILQYAKVMRLDEGDFEESKHPRDESGRFTDGAAVLSEHKGFKLRQLDPGDVALTSNDKGEIWAQTVKKNGKLSDSSSRVTHEQAREMLKSGQAYRLEREEVRVRAPAESYEQRVQREVDEGRRIQPADWSAAMNRDT